MQLMPRQDASEWLRAAERSDLFLYISEYGGKARARCASKVLFFQRLRKFNDV